MKRALLALALAITLSGCHWRDVPKHWTPTPDKPLEFPCMKIGGC